jgi:hypothetical protein
MIVLTQLVYIHPGKEKAFEDFEGVVLPLLPNYGGTLMLRLRTGAENLIAGSLEAPYEVHLIRFESEAGFTAYSNDETRQRFLHLKNESVRSSLLFRGA